jgi:hypothetical protein
MSSKSKSCSSKLRVSSIFLFKTTTIGFSTSCLYNFNFVPSTTICLSFMFESSNFFPFQSKVNGSFMPSSCTYALISLIVPASTFLSNFDLSNNS